MKGAIFQESGEIRLNCSSVGAIDGGGATQPLARVNSVTSFDFATTGIAAICCPSSGNPSLNPTARSVAAMMPRMIEPRTRRACSAAVTSRPTKKTIRSGEANCGLSFQPVAGSSSSKCVLFMPISTMNSPMPTAMPLRMLGLIASINFSRTPSIESSRKTTPE